MLDTDVLSEALRPAPPDAILRWLAAQDPAAVFTTAITQAELLYGVEVLPAGKRRSGRPADLPGRCSLHQLGPHAGGITERKIIGSAVDW